LQSVWVGFGDPPLLRGAPVQVGAVDIGRDHQQVGGELLGQQR